jgi:hypothetical protein
MSNELPVPNVLWIAIISLAVFGISHFIIGFTKPLQFLALGVNLILIFGLLGGFKWAYVLSIITSLLGPFLLLFNNFINFYVVLLLNSMVLIPVLISTRYFFPKASRQK